MTRQDAIYQIKNLAVLSSEKDMASITEALNMAIAALEQEETLQNLTKPNKSDLIVKGAGEIKDGLYNIKDGKLFKYKANGGTVRTYPIVSAGWIPCSERLPEENEPVLVGIRYKDDFKMVVTARMDVTYWQGLGRDIKGEMRWMPLPEPYKESEE